MFASLSTGNENTVGLPRAVIAAALGAGVVTLALLLALHARGDGTRTAAARPAPPPAAATCDSRLLRDWSDGRIDGTYPVGCYRTALRSLPADLKVYSSAPDDIAQALSQRIVQSHHPQKISEHQGARSVRKIASAP
jgi:hypothetical protein